MTQERFTLAEIAQYVDAHHASLNGDRTPTPAPPAGYVPPLTPVRDTWVPARDD